MENSEYLQFLNQLSKQFKFIDLSKLQSESDDFFVVSHDLFIFSLFIYRLDENKSINQHLEMEFTGFISRYVVFAYLGDEYLNNVLIRAMLECVYKIIFASFYTDKPEHKIRKMTRGDLSRKIESKLNESQIEHLKNLDNLYSKYSKVLHNSNEGIDEKMSGVIEQFGENSIGKEQKEDLQKIFTSLVNLYNFKMHSFINAPERLYINNHISKANLTIVQDLIG